MTDDRITEFRNYLDQQIVMLEEAVKESISVEQRIFYQGLRINTSDVRNRLYELFPEIETSETR